MSENNNIPEEPEKAEKTEKTEDTAPEITENTESDEITDSSDSSEIDKPESSEKPEKKSEQPIYKTAAILGIITLAVALLLAVLNFITGPDISEREKAEENNALKNLFGDRISFEELTGYERLYEDFPARITEILTVKDADTSQMMGYCVTVAPKGYGGAINMLVAVNPDGSVKDTEIVSMSETPAQGMKINSTDFRDQFINKTKDIKLGGGGANSIDAMASATVSSKAFLNGVNSALEIIDEILSDKVNTTAQSDTVSTGISDTSGT